MVDCSTGLLKQLFLERKEMRTSNQKIMQKWAALKMQDVYILKFLHIL